MSKIEIQYLISISLFLLIFGINNPFICIALFIIASLLLAYTIYIEKI